jgi:hypothetical protein
MAEESASAGEDGELEASNITDGMENFAKVWQFLKMLNTEPLCA